MSRVFYGLINFCCCLTLMILIIFYNLKVIQLQSNGHFKSFCTNTNVDLRILRLFLYLLLFFCSHFLNF